MTRKNRKFVFLCFLVYSFSDPYQLSTLVSNLLERNANDGNQGKDCKGNVDHDWLPHFTVIGDSCDADRANEVEDVIDDDIGHDVGSEEAVADKDEGGADPSKDVE